jgi:hypothetical protein
MLVIVACGVDAAGRVLAKGWCPHCHIVSEDQRIAPAEGVPTFFALGRAPTTNIGECKGSRQTGRIDNRQVGTCAKAALLPNGSRLFYDDASVNLHSQRGRSSARPRRPPTWARLA